MRRTAGSGPELALAVVPGPSGLISSLVSAARRHFAADRPEIARAFLQLVRRSVRRPGRTWRDLGRLHFEQGEFEAAGQAFGYAAAYDPEDADLQTSLALTCLRLRDIRNFEGYLRRALRLDPGNRAALELLAEVTREHGDPLTASDLYRRLLRFRPRHRGYRQALALCHLQLATRATVLHLIRRSRTDASAAPSIPSTASQVGSSGSDRARQTPGPGGADLPEP